jgi:hypothetical protein
MLSRRSSRSVSRWSRATFVAVLAALGLSVSAAGALAQGETRTQLSGVIELFTSQGCSSCPPADRLMGELAKDPSLLVLTLPVDYWDYLGWRDTLAHAAFTARQKGYSAMRGDRQVYTPQAVINGVAHAVGSEREALARAIAASRAEPSTLGVAMAIDREGNGFLVRIGAAPAGVAGQGIVVVMPVANSRVVQIGRGENNGRSVTYTNVVRGLTVIGTWDGDSRTMPIPAAALGSDSDGFVVLLQSGHARKPGRILAAAHRSALSN